MTNYPDSDYRHPKHRIALWGNLLTVAGLVLTGFTFFAAQSASEKAEAAEQAARDAETAAKRSSQRVTLVSYAEPHVSRMAEFGDDFESRCRIALTYAEIEISEYGSDYIVQLLGQVLDLSADERGILNCSGHADALQTDEIMDQPEGNETDGFNSQEIVLATYRLENCHTARLALQSFIENSDRLHDLEGTFKLAVSKRYARVIFSADAQDQQADLLKFREVGRAVEENPTGAFEQQNLRFVAGAYLAATSGWVDASSDDACIEGASFEDF